MTDTVRELRPAQGRVVAWLQQDGDGAVIMSTRVMESQFEIPRVPLAACKKYGTTASEIAANIEIREGHPVEAVEFPDGTVGVMFYKETR